MNEPEQGVTRDSDCEGDLMSSRATGRLTLPISDEDLFRLQEARNDPAFYNAVVNEMVVTAGWMPKPTVEPQQFLLPPTSAEQTNREAPQKVSSITEVTSASH